MLSKNTFFENHKTYLVGGCEMKHMFRLELSCLSRERNEVNPDLVLRIGLQVLQRVRSNRPVDQRSRSVDLPVNLLEPQLNPIDELQLVLGEFPPNYVHPRGVDVRDCQAGFYRDHGWKG